jgi:hypothetical protein
MARVGRWGSGYFSKDRLPRSLTIAVWLVASDQLHHGDQQAQSHPQQAKGNGEEY